MVADLKVGEANRNLYIDCINDRWVPPDIIPLLKTICERNGHLINIHFSNNTIKVECIGCLQLFFVSTLMLWPCEPESFEEAQFFSKIKLGSQFCSMPVSRN